MVIQLNAQHVFHSLEEMWAYAETHNPVVLSAHAYRSVASKNIDEAYGALMPTLTANGAYTDNIEIQPTLIPSELFGGEPGTFQESTFGRQHIYNVNLLAQVDLINTKNWFAIKSAKHNYELAESKEMKSRKDLYEQVASAYYRHKLMVEAERLAHESYVISVETYAAVRNRFDEGQISITTLNTALINLRKAELKVEEARHGKFQATNDLKMFLNIAHSEPMSIVDDESEVSLIQKFSFDANNDPDVKLAEGELLSARNTLKTSKAAYTPTLSAVYNAGVQVAGDQFMGFDGTNTLPQQYWGLRLTVPILTGNSRNYQIDKSRIELENKQMHYESARLQSSLYDENLSSAYNKAYRAYSRSKDILALYGQNDRHAIRKMDEGVMSVDDRLKVYQDFIIYQDEHLKNMADYFIQHYNVLVRQKTF